jgi:hypothetical protein
VRIAQHIGLVTTFAIWRKEKIDGGGKRIGNFKRKNEFVSIKMLNDSRQENKK